MNTAVGAPNGEITSIWDDGYVPGQRGGLLVDSKSSLGIDGSIWGDDNESEDDNTSDQGSETTPDDTAGIWGDGYRSPDVLLGPVVPDTEALLDDAFYPKSVLRVRRARTGRRISRLVRRALGIRSNPNTIYSNLPFPPEPQLLEKIHGLDDDNGEQIPARFGGDELNPDNLGEVTGGRRANIRGMSRLLVINAIESVRRRSVPLVAPIGILAVGASALAYSFLGGGSGSGASTEQTSDKFVRPGVEQTVDMLSGVNGPEYPDATIQSVYGAMQNLAEEPATEQPSVTIEENGNLSFSIYDWLSGQGVSDQAAIRAATPKIVDAIGIENPGMNVHVVYAGQQVRLPDGLAGTVLRNLLSAQNTQ